MWDWKQLEWVNYVGWDVRNAGTENLKIFTRLKGYYFFWVTPFNNLGYVVHIYLRVRNGEYRDTVTMISELQTTTGGALKAFQWAYRGAEIRSIIEDIEELDKRRKRYFSEDNHTDSIMNYRTKACTRYPYLFLATLLTGFHWLMRPVMGAINGQYVPMAEDWVPWDDTHFTGWLIHLLYLVPALLSGIGGMMAYETLTLSFSEMTIGLIESISYGLKSLKFEEKNVQHKLRELTQMHQDALEITRKMRSFMNFIIQADCLLLTFRVCCGVFVVTSSGSSSARKINTVESLLLCTTFFYLQCYKCQILTAKHMDVGTAVYDNDWYKGTAEEKRNLLIIAEKAKENIPFGGVFKIDVSTFIAVMKTTFSSYNVLKALDIR